MNDFYKKLEKIKGNNKNPFSVPEGYFEKFPIELNEKIISENREYLWIIKLFRFVKPQIAFGLMIFAFALIAITTVNLIQTNKSNSGIDSDLYSRTIEIDATEFTEQHFIDVLLEDEKKVDDHKLKDSDFYIHYLMNENIDYRTLYDELY
ncbi:MAG: hypothetical protein GQ564_19695 [Bacteroidales bacterium]|nr:hypothetical protein [Bacteroidales bacterium]